MISAIIAHRGASALATHENTLEAFQIAIDLQADFAEFDIRKTRDHQLIAFHNPDLNGVDIRTLTYEEICKITGQKGYRVPLLLEVLKLCHGKIKLDIELKETGYEQEIIDMVERFYDYSDYMMKSFIDRSVLRIKELDPNIKAGLLIGTPRNNIVHRLNEYFPMHRLHVCKADFISPHYQFVTRDFILRMHLHHKEVYVWTVNDIAKMSKLIRRGVDGIITDRPDFGLQARMAFE